MLGTVRGEYKSDRRMTNPPDENGAALYRCFPADDSTRSLVFDSCPATKLIPDLSVGRKLREVGSP